MDKYINKRLDGRYEISEILGSGGMAVVYKAYDNVYGKTVAVKILREEFLANDEFKRRFKNESKAIAVLSHPNIVKVLDVSLGDVLQYIVMEYIEGITLKEHIEQNGYLNYDDAVYYSSQILQALTHAHENGIVHRDIKPQNIILLPDFSIKVTDFGIARFSGSEQRTMTDKTIGSVHYISPEQVRGDYTDEKTDIYAVGVMLYEMLTGQLPFEADSAVSVAIMQLQSEAKPPRQIVSSIPIGLEQITLHSMAKNPKNRYQSTELMLNDLKIFTNDNSAVFSLAPLAATDMGETKYIPNLNDGTIMAAKNLEEDEEEEKRVQVVPILAGIAAAFLVAIAIVFAFIYSKYISVPQDVVYDCPNFIEQTIDEVNANTTYEKLDIKFEEKNNAAYPYGTIFAQNISPGSDIKETTPIVLTYSLGPESFVMDDYNNQDVTKVKDELGARGIKYKEVHQFNESLAKNTIIKTDPPSGTTIKQTDEITLYISDGPKPKPATVPDVTKLELEDAKKEIQRSKLVVGKVQEVDSELPKGYIQGQSPAAGTTTEEGKEVLLYVSNGIIPKVNYSFPAPITEDLVAKNAVITCYVDDAGEFTKVFQSAPTDLSTTKDIAVSFQTDQVLAPGTEVWLSLSHDNGLDPAQFAKYTVSEDGKSINLVEQYNVPDYYRTP